MCGKPCRYTLPYGNLFLMVIRLGYMRASSDSDRQSTNLQRDALLAAGVDARHLFEDHASGAKDDRTGLAQALDSPAECTGAEKRQITVNPDMENVSTSFVERQNLTMRMGI